MRFILRIVLAALVVFVLQVTVAHRLAVIGAVPDLVLVLLAVLVIDRGPVIGVVAGFLLGFLQDLGNAELLGMNALAKSVVGYGIARFGGDYLPDNPLFRGLLVFAAALANDVIVLNISRSFDAADVVTTFLRSSLLSGIYTAVLAVVVIQVVRLLPGRVVRPGGRY
ncbi:MAG: rod shape-determining protein MreD [Candidatus Krumholzibacteria bacterium]|nr:rod shape-determining protein MreD [Candidatus Krumholzibacteria bacterium]